MKELEKMAVAHKSRRKLYLDPKTRAAAFNEEFPDPDWNALTEREKEMLELWLHNAYTFEQVGQEMGICKARVAVLQDSAFMHLRFAARRKLVKYENL